jgi:hypothetical protein
MLNIDSIVENLVFLARPEITNFAVIQCHGILE